MDPFRCQLPENNNYKFIAILTAVITVLLSFITILGNSFVILALIKTKRIQSQSNLLLGGLCATDLVAGVAAQPLFVVRRILEVRQDMTNEYCILVKIHIYFGYLSVGASITTLAIVSLDRWFAICRPFLYKEYQSKGKCLALIIIDWILIAILLFCPFIGLPSIAIYIGGGTVALISIATIIICYMNIYIVLQRHRKRISQEQTVSQAEASEIRNERSAEKRRTNTIAILIWTLFLCYTPHLIIICIKSVTGKELYVESRVGETIILMNSSLNPIIYCLRSTEIRTAVTDMLKKAFRKG